MLPQPLAPVGGKPAAGENRALGQALIEYQGAMRRGATPDAVGPLEAFLRLHPRSRWRAALELNLGIIYRRSGHMSKALAAWQGAWDLAKHATDPKARAIADYSVGQLAEFEAYLGRMETLAPLLSEVKGRPMQGAGAANIAAASQGLAEMHTRPQDAFRCGPMALHRICLLQGRTDGVLALENSRSTIRGTSLLQVVELAHKVGLDYQMAYRQPGAALIVPAVMHWKVGHFAAVIATNGGRYRLEDPTFGEDILVSRATVDEEGSGYFVVPAGPLPRGWRPASQTEGERIWGRGITSSQAPATPNPVHAISRSCGGSGMTTVNAQASTVSLTLYDAPLSYQTSRGPAVSFELFYSHRDALQPVIFTYTNFGPKWTSNWISYFTNNIKSTGTADLYAPGGGIESYHPSGDLTPTGGIIFIPGVDDQALVTSTVSAGQTTGYIRALPDGSTQTFARRLGTNQYFLSAVADPQGNRVTLTYDVYTRITTITDAAGKQTKLTYGLAGDGFKVTKVTDPFGRSALFTYNSDGELASITDTLGITSSYAYLFGSGDFITSLTTPYGVSKFTYGDATTDYRLGTGIFLTITDPLGQTQRVEFRQQAPGIPDSDPPSLVPVGMPATNEFLSFRDTFVWNPHQLALATLPDGEFDYTKATMLHFLHAANFGQTSGVIESVKQPLENRVFYAYPGSGLSVGNSNLPSAIGRVLDNGATQLETFQYNSFGLVAQFADPVGRQRTLTYAANGIDPLTIANTTGGKNQLLLSATYNAQHQPLTVTDASGQATKYTYNAAGQLLTATDATGAKTTYTYGATGLLLSAAGPIPNSTTSYTYDALNRRISSTDPQGYKMLFGYDAADRLLSIGYPDTTTTKLVYNKLDLVSVTNRLKFTTNYLFDADRQAIQVTDPLGHITRATYCDCGAIAKIADPNGHATTFNYDVQDRPISKIYADNTATKFFYEKATSRLRAVTDALGQTSFFAYDPADSPIVIAYGGAVHPTAPISFTLDHDFLRVLAMTDGTGRTTYTYNPVVSPPALGAGLLKSVTDPRANTVSYTYDPLGRTLKATVDGAVSQYTYDAMGRIATHQDPLDTFTFSYFGATGFPSSIRSIAGLNSFYGYLGATGDERLRSIANYSHGGSLISYFQYAHNAEGQLTATVIQKQFASTIVRSTGYDAARRLISMTPSVGNAFAFGYDAAGNRISEKIGAATKTFAYNSVNALTSPAPATYDKDGQPLTLGSATYQWDAAHRLIAVTAGNNTTRFAYDGLGHRTRITQLTGSAVASDKFYFWCGSGPCVERDALHLNAITKRYLAEGLQVSGQPFYYAADYLGSVRELVNSLGAVEASYDYDPYGVRTKLLGAMDSDFGFAGLFHESRSGLDLAVYRPYAAALGRWLNRDPIGESSGLNLYAYAQNNPATLVDPKGLFAIAFGGDSIVGGYFGLGGGIGASSGVVCGTDGCWHIVCRTYGTVSASGGVGLGAAAGAGGSVYVSPFGNVNTFNGAGAGFSGDVEIGPFGGSVGVSAPRGDLTSFGINFGLNAGPPSASVNLNVTRGETVEGRDLFVIGIQTRTPRSILNEDRKNNRAPMENSFPQNQTPGIN